MRGQYTSKHMCQKNPHLSRGKEDQVASRRLLSRVRPPPRRRCPSDCNLLHAGALLVASSPVHHHRPPPRRCPAPRAPRRANPRHRRRICDIVIVNLSPPPPPPYLVRRTSLLLFSPSPVLCRVMLHLVLVLGFRFHLSSFPSDRESDLVE